MAHLLLCFRPLRSDSQESGHGSLPRIPRIRGQDVTRASSSDSGVSQEPQRTVAFVELLKHRNEPLGLVLKGGADCNQPVYVGQLHPGGVAQKSGALQIGDHIRGINGTATDHLNENEANALLRNSGNVINLEIEFEAPPGSDIDSGTMKKTAQVRLRRERNGFGFTINGGRTENRPITVSNVIVGSFAYKNGFLKAGDRVLKVNYNNVSKSTLMEALSFLKASEDLCILEIEYDVTIHEGLGEYRGQLMVELLKPKGATLGMTLHEPFSPGSPLVVSKLKEAGIADRCGALHVGDRLLSVNKESLEGKSIVDVYRMLRHCDLNVELKIIPAHNFTPSSPSFSHRVAESMSETASMLSHPPPPPRSQRSAQDTHSMASFSSLATSHVLTTHPEMMVVQLEADEIGYGLSLQGGATDRGVYPLVISAIDGGGPAAKLGRLQVGDQILSINGIKMAGYSLQEALKLVQEADNEIELEVMYEVQDATPPSSGTFDVHLTKTCSLNLGVTINGSVSRGDIIWISSLKKGGVAYRSGMLHSGDAILAINDQSLEWCNLRDAAQILKNTEESVMLRIAKASCTPPSAPSTETIIYSVELHRNQKGLGITLTGSSDQPGHPVVISKVKENGVAHKTGALKAGDRVLAINGESLYNKTLHEALRMLNAAGDTVSLKISKAKRKHKLRHKSGSPTSKLRVPHSGSSLYHRDSFGSSGSSLLGASQQGLAGHSSCGGTRGHAVSRFLNDIEPSRFSFKSPGVSASAYYTPAKNGVSAYPPPPSASLYIDPREARGGRMNLECSNTSHSQNSGLLRNAFNPTGSSVLGMPRPHMWNGLYMGPGSVARDGDRLSSSGFSPGRNRRMPYGHSHSLDHQSGAELQYLVKHQRLMDRGVSGGGVSKRDSSTDDEMSVYDSDGKGPKYRRTELPDRSHYALNPRQSHRSSRVDEGGRMWDFKTRGHACKGHIPIGRVSPITPAETERASMTSLYSHQHIKANLKLKVDQDPCQGSSQSCAPKTVHAPSKGKEEEEQLQGEEEAEQKITDTHNETSGSMDDTQAQPSLTSLQGGGSQQEREDDEVGEPPPLSQLAAPPQPSHHTSSSTLLNSAPQSRSTTPQEVLETDCVIDEPLCCSHELPVPSSSEARLSQELLKSCSQKGEGVEGTSIETERAKHYCNSPTGKHCRSCLTSEHMTNRAVPVDYLSSSLDSHSAALDSSLSSVFSPLRRTNSSHRAPHTINPTSLQSSIHKHDIVVTESRLRHRDQSDHSSSRRLESSPPLCTKVDSGKSLKLAPILSEFKKTIDNADKFGRAMAALAESGSSDQDSDSESHSKLAISVLPPHESAKVTEKMRTPQSSSMRQKVIIRKNPGEMSFGFSIADGQYDLGVYVKTIKPGGPSDRGGLLQYDMIIKVNEVLLLSDHTLASICALLKSHDRELVLTVARQAQQ